MNLRLRLALYAALTVALALGGAGLFLRQALAASLLARVDRELQGLLGAAALQVAEDEEGRPRLELDGSLLEALLPGSLLLLLSPEGLEDAVGLLPPLATLEALARGEGKGYRLRAQELGELRLLAARDLREVQAASALLDRLLLPALLLGALGAGGLALALADRALRPLSRTTQAALALARERAWRRRLPSPASRDEVEELVEAFNRALEALEEALEAERRFAREAAHALRTPFTVLLGELARGRVEAARAQAERLRELVDRLLLLARAEADALERSLVDLDALVFAEAEGLRPAFRERGLALELELPEEPVRALGHEAALRAVVVSLLENALQHTARGGWVRVRVGEEGLVVESAPSRPSPGSGLGLRLAQTLAQAQGAVLALEGGEPFRVAFRPARGGPLG